MCLLIKINKTLNCSCIWIDQFGRSANALWIVTKLGVKYMELSIRVEKRSKVFKSVSNERWAWRYPTNLKCSTFLFFSMNCTLFTVRFNLRVVFWKRLENWSLFSVQNLEIIFFIMDILSNCDTKLSSRPITVINLLSHWQKSDENPFPWMQTVASSWSGNGLTKNKVQ